jgi:hypothetical protein
MRKLRRDRASMAVAAVALAVLGCQATMPPPSARESSPPAAGTSSAAVAISPSPSPATREPSPWWPATPAPSTRPPTDPAFAALDAARAKWTALRLGTFAYSAASWNSSGFGAFRVRVTALEGALRAQMLDGAAEPVRQLTPDTLFAMAQELIASPGSIDIAYDAKTGLPTRIHASGPPNTSDADTNIDIADFVAGPTPNAKGIRQSIAWALRDWSRARPATFAYTWTRAAPGAQAPDRSVQVSREAGGAEVIDPATAASGAASPTVASVPATLHAASAALASGAWVDLTVQFGNGVPLLLAVDPTPAAGDAYWIQVAFRDIEREQQLEAYRAARERWSAAGLGRYHYVWHYRGTLGTYTYRVTMRGEVAHLMRRKGTAVLWQAIDVGPRLDGLFPAIDLALADGRRVIATYDPTYGYPLTVKIDTGGSNPYDAITISDFVVG